MRESHEVPRDLALVDKVTWCLLPVEGGKYPTKLVDLRESWLGHHSHKKHKFISELCVYIHIFALLKCLSCGISEIHVIIMSFMIEKRSLL